jgi:hypothetical protein
MNAYATMSRAISRTRPHRSRARACVVRCRRTGTRARVFLTSTTQHAQSPRWGLETARGLAALANVVAWAGLLYIVFLP